MCLQAALLAVLVRDLKVKLAQATAEKVMNGGTAASFCFREHLRLVE